MRKALLVLLLFAIVTAGMTWPLVLHAASGVEDYQDALLNTWILAWEGHQLLSDPLHLFDANIFHPYRNTLAFSEIILPSALIALPVTTASSDPVLGYNVALLASFVLSALASYLLVLRLTRNRWAGLAAGVVFAFNAYKMSNIAQAQLLVLQWLPLALLYLGRSLHRPTRCNLSLLALFFVLQALSSFYYAVLSALALVVYLLSVAVRRRGFSLRSGAAVAIALAAGCLVMLPFVLPYLKVEGELGFRRALQDSVPFSASLAQYGQALPGSFLYGKLAARSAVMIGGYPLDSLFPGAATLALALLGLAVGRRRLDVRLFAVVLGAVAFALSLGPRLQLEPGRMVELPFAMPYELLYGLPGMQALRAPVRFAALVFLALSVLTGLGVAALTNRRRLGGVIGLSCVAVLALDVAVMSPVQIRPVPVGADVPQTYQWLAAREHGAIIELPLISQNAERGLLNQYFSTYHWHTTPDGYSGFIPPSHGQLAYELGFFPSERSVSLLQGLGVRFVVVHTDFIADWTERRARLGAFATEVAIVHQDGPVVVYELRRQTTEARPVLEVFLPRAVGASQPYRVSIIALNRATRSLVISPTEKATVEARWIATGTSARSQVASAQLPIVISEAGVATASLQPPPEGTYELAVRVSLPGQESLTASAKVTVGKERVAQAEVAPVRLVAGSAERQSYRPGETVRVSLVWRPLGKVDDYYSVFVRLLDQDGVALVQQDGQPAGNTRPTLLWVPGQEVEDRWELVIPPWAPAGRYTVETGLYRPEDLSPRLTLDADGLPLQRLLIGSVRVAAPLEADGPPSAPASANLEERVALTGYDIEGCAWVESVCRVSRGARLSLTLYWRALTEMTADYTVFVHLADAAGRPVAQHDGRPRNGTYPTPVWLAGDVVQDRHDILVPADAPAGNYRLLTGMYILATGDRLRVVGGGDSVLLFPVTVEP